MLYLDTSVLLVYTLTQAVETERVPATEALLHQIMAGSVLGATSFYALQEIHIFAIDNAPDFPTGAVYGKAALEKVLALPHAIAAIVYGCDTIVAYDTHFRAISRMITYKTPEDFLSRWHVVRILPCS